MKAPPTSCLDVHIIHNVLWMHSNLFVQALSFAAVSEGYDSSCFDSDTAPSFYESLSKYPLLIITVLVLETNAPTLEDLCWRICC
jgi:hypothetical protein